MRFGLRCARKRDRSRFLDWNKWPCGSCEHFPEKVAFFVSAVGGGSFLWLGRMYNAVEANPNLYVHNVPKDSNEEELRHLFGQFGTVERVRLKVNQKVGPHAVYAFVTFTSTEDAQRALSKLQGSDLRGRALRIEFQRTTASSATGGYYGTWATAEETSAGSMSPPAATAELRTPNLRTASSTAASDHIFRDTTPQTNNVMWGSAAQPALGGWSSRTSDATSPAAADMPPFKRGRFHSPSSQRRPRSPTRSANVVAPDHLTINAPNPNASETLALWSQLKQLVSQSHPHAVGLVDTLGEMLRPEAAAPMKPNVVHPAVPVAERWPLPELTPAQRAFTRDGTLTLNQDNHRYLVRLSPLLAPLKPAMFARRSMGGSSNAPPDRLTSDKPPPTQPQQQPHHQRAAEMVPSGFSSQPYVAPPTVVQPLPTSLVNNKPFEAQPPPTVLVDKPPSSEETAWLGQLEAMPITPAKCRDVVWVGTLANNKKKKINVSMKRLAGYIDHDLTRLTTVLNISHRSALEEMWKKKIGAIGILEAESPGFRRGLQDYIKYFKEKNRAGVARLEGSEYQMVYLLPIGLANLGEHITSNLPTSGECLLAITGRQHGSKDSSFPAPDGDEEAKPPVINGGEQPTTAMPASSEHESSPPSMEQSVATLSQQGSGD
eukprot:Protomagalhaensia_sp_Gyna_25__2440@NODE_235_length_4246_cov_72_331828_g182_i0_p2_GENE_NODE_235_length_4246_cov_72_331828_g182_i0NODE_235_length_4246_cov_72_331828_g182_i0_p2_ORF_typecomplete_len659_score102_66RRM_1/PF00076_22/7_7e20RRM_5/PF13893_6/1_3e12SPOC/PF07744_13/5_7e11Limkainb1/PF11608_8/2_6e07RRM_Rrp7/PF17799_1/1_5e05RRM_7/PF16367_5/8_4e05RRM_occluded/PF16842_5/0_00032RRM_8/PF11835_8/0_00035RRM_3/PF08777_11/0_002RL/PF17797_1/0_0027Nup35_RRM_2/PF14605_6/0_011PHM7_cyt/PF14703_6/29PHM7_cyt/